MRRDLYTAIAVVVLAVAVIFCAWYDTRYAYLASTSTVAFAKEADRKIPGVTQQEPGFVTRASDPLAIFTGLLALGTFWLAIVSTRQITLARREFNATHRPRIRIKHVWLTNDILDDDPLQIRLVFTNVGDMPARINQCGVGIRVLASDVPLPPDIRYPGFVVSAPSPIGLGITIDVAVDTGREVTPGEAVDIRSGDRRLYCIGHIEYLDTNDPPRIRRTNFARLLRVPSERRPGFDFYRFHPLDPVDPDYEYED